MRKSLNDSAASSSNNFRKADRRTEEANRLTGSRWNSRSVSLLANVRIIFANNNAVRY